MRLTKEREKILNLAKEFLESNPDFPEKGTITIPLRQEEYTKYYLKRKNENWTIHELTDFDMVITDTVIAKQNDRGYGFHLNRSGSIIQNIDMRG